MFGESVGEAGAALHRAAHLSDRVGESAVTRVLCREREHAVERHSCAEHRRGVPGPERQGGTATESTGSPHGAAGRRFIDCDGIELLATQLLKH